MSPDCTNCQCNTLEGGPYLTLIKTKEFEMMSDYNINGLAIPLFLFFMVIEYVALRLRGRSLHRYNDSVASLSMGMCLLFSDAFLKAYTFAVFIYLWDHFRFFDFQTSDPMTWIIFFFGVDFCYYWFHRFAHEINFLWGAHVGHHQSEEYNLTTALRQSAFQYAFSWVFYLPLALLGCPPEVFLLQFIFLKLYQFWLHTQGIDRIPGLEGVFSTPSSHRVHHAKNPVYIDRNYGGTLIIWDRLFGTWQPELKAEPCHYGTTRPLDTFNPIKANLEHWSMLASDTVHTRSWTDKFGLWFKPTGWRPQDCIEKGKDMTSSLQKTGTQEREKYDPRATKGTKLYVALSMVLTFLGATMFIFLAPQLSATVGVVGSLIIIGGLVIANGLMENNKRLRYLEFIRLPAMLVLIGFLWTKPVTTEVIDTVAIERSKLATLNYASTPDLWPEWHPQSLKVYLEDKVPLKTGEGFEEDIMTPIGQNHLIWKVLAAKAGDHWIAHAENQDNGALIELEYWVTEQNGVTSFERRLRYTLPNFALVAANALYMKSKIEKKSEVALLKLKEVLEMS